MPHPLKRPNSIHSIWSPGKAIGHYYASQAPHHVRSSTIGIAGFTLSYPNPNTDKSSLVTYSPSVALTELVGIVDDAPSADDIAFLDNRDTNAIIDEFLSEPSDAESEAVESVSDNSSEDNLIRSDEHRCSNFLLWVIRMSLPDLFSPSENRTEGLPSSSLLSGFGHLSWVVKMKLPFEDFYRILAKKEAYKEAGFDSANINALQKLRDFDDNEDRKDHYNLTKWGLIRDPHGMSRFVRKGLADGIDQFVKKIQLQEDDDAEVFAIQQEEQHSSGSRGAVPNNPGPAVPMSPTKTRPTPLFVSESASTPRLPSSFGSSQFGTSAFGHSSHQATPVNNTPTLSVVRTQFVRFAHQDRARSPSTTQRPPPSPLPLESLSSLFPIPTSSSPQRIISPTPSVGSPELVEIVDENMPNAENLAFLDARETDVILNEYRGDCSDEESEAEDSVSANSSEDTHNSAELENKIVDPTWEPEAELDQEVNDDEEVEEEIVVDKSARRVEPFPVSSFF